MGEDVPLNTLCMNCSSQEERRERKSYLLFDNTARREAVGEWLFPPLITLLHFPMKNSTLNLPFFSADDLLKHCFLEKQLQSQ